MRAPPDGYTLLQVSTAAAINATLYEKLNYHFIRDIAPVAGIIRTSQIVVVNPSISAKTLPEFIAYAKANPGKINMASPGNGTLPHLAGELFKMMTGVNITFVSYRGDAPALTDLLGGQVQMMIPAPLASIEYIRAGKLRALAVTTPTRWKDCQTSRPWASSCRAMKRALGSASARPSARPPRSSKNSTRRSMLPWPTPKMRARLADMGGTALPGLPADFGKLIAAETEKWAKVIRAANIKAE